MKKRGMKKRVMAALMTACMVVGSVRGCRWRMCQVNHLVR